MERRKFIESVLGGAALLGGSPLLCAQSTANVVVVGGGFAGGTAARYLKHWGGSSINVTLVNKNPGHYSCILSNLVLNQSKSLSDLYFGYDTLQTSFGVNVIEDDAVDINFASKNVRLAANGWLPYDRLILAPGIKFDSPSGWNTTTMPHAWIAGQSTQHLADQLQALEAGSTVVVTIPPSPYRCPPGPYERACLIADFLRSKFPADPGQVIVLDANSQIQAERATFSDAFNTLYSSIIDYRPNVAILSVDPGGHAVETNAGTINGDLINIIAPHRAAAIVSNTGLTGGGKWAPVNPLTYESTLPGSENVHIIGDSQATGQPKSGHMANSQAKICADAILRMFADEAVDTPERRASVMTNSACFSPITATTSSWLTAVYAYDGATAQMKLSGNSLGEAGEWSVENFESMLTWAEALFADTFGQNARTTPPPFPQTPVPTQVPITASIIAAGGLGAAVLGWRATQKSRELG